MIQYAFQNNLVLEGQMGIQAQLRSADSFPPGASVSVVIDMEMLTINLFCLYHTFCPPPQEHTNPHHCLLSLM